MASFKIEPLQIDDLEEFTRLYWAAFEPLDADMVMPMIYPGGLQHDLMERLKKRVLQETDGKLSDFCFCARDLQSGEMVAVAWWALVEHPAKNQQEIDTVWEQANKARNGGAPVAEMNSALGEAFLRAAVYAEYNMIRGQPYMSLRLLATHPAHHRRGAGSLLLRQGLEKADRLNLPVYLDAGVNGRPLYLRHGFTVTSDFPFDGRQHGGRSEGKHWCMLRPAQDIDAAAKGPRAQR
ncbi:hypothetical protein LTR85_001687 [Meristemomyces frigidus]|nr:hypothetical protein LTR85_001687 [Meristemomyces frigidus]